MAINGTLVAIIPHTSILKKKRLEFAKITFRYPFALLHPKQLTVHSLCLPYVFQTCTPDIVPAIPAPG